MFNKSKSNNEAITPGSLNVFGVGTEVDGNITANGDIRVDGLIKGNLTTSSKCILGAQGKITGNITAKNCDISGLVLGDLMVSEVLLLKNTAEVRGNIRTDKFVVESGGKFNGKCEMGTNEGYQAVVSSEE